MKMQAKPTENAIIFCILTLENAKINWRENICICTYIVKHVLHSIRQCIEIEERKGNQIKNFMSIRIWIEIWIKCSFFLYTVVPRSCATIYCAIFAATPFWICSKKSKLSYFFKKIQVKLIFQKERDRLFFLSVYCQFSH